MNSWERLRKNCSPKSHELNFVLFARWFGLTLTPVAGLNLLPEKVSRFSELSSEFEFWGSFSSNVKVNPVFSWKGQNSFQRIFPSCSQHLTTPPISFEFSGFHYTSNSFLIKPINTNDRKTCPFREILSQQIGRGEDRVEYCGQRTIKDRMQIIHFNFNCFYYWKQ